MAAIPTLSLLFSLICSLLVNIVHANHDFENTAIVRTIELGGSLVHVRTTYAVRALKSSVNTYSFALGEREGARTSFVEVKVKGRKDDDIEVQEFGYKKESAIYLYAAVLPKALKLNDSATIEVETVQTHSTYPWPKHVNQGDDLSVKHEADLFVLSPYKTLVQRTKFRAPKPQILSFTEPKNVESFTLDNAVAKSGATITYGPFSNLPASANRDFIEKHQQKVTIHYKHGDPLLEITNLERHAEISHWGENLSIEDHIWLRNAGPKLRGHFSRLEHMQQQYFQKPAPHIVRGIALQLPPGISNVYYTDRIGNVSTSRFRGAPSVPKGQPPRQWSILELRPRFPLMGGWNYSFTLGWDSPLRDYAAYARDGRYVVAVPLTTLYPDTAIDEAEVRIVLPEGATDLEVYPPFPPKTSSLSVHKTYLDTTGRPIITLTYEQLTDRHIGDIYVAYRVPLLAHLRKPLVVASVIFGLFITFIAAGGIDTKIQRTK